MNNKAKISTLYFAIDDLVISICTIVNRGENSAKVDSCELFNNILFEAKSQYFQLKKAEKSRVLMIKFHATRALEKLQSRIEKYLGELGKDDLDLIYTLWIALDFTLTEYFSVRNNKSNFMYEIDDRLKFGYQKYLLMSQSKKKLKITKVKLKKFNQNSRNA